MTDKQRLFIEAYLGRARLNATRAARMAGYADPEKEGWRVRQDPEVAAEIRGRVAEYGMSADEVVAEIADIARHSRLESLLDAETYGKPTVQLRSPGGSFKRAVRYLRKISLSEEAVGVEVHDRMKALELLGKVHGVFLDRTRHEGAIALSPQADLSRLSDDELEQLEGLLAKSQQAPAGSVE